MARLLAILTILFLSSSTFYSSGWYCILASGKCCATGSTDRCSNSAPSKPLRSCSSPCNPESQSAETSDPCTRSCERRRGTKDASECGAAASAECFAKVAGTLEPESQSAVPTGRPGFSTACNQPDNTRCARREDFPRDCKPARCFLIHPLLAAPPPKVPAPIDAPALQLLDLQYWVERPQVYSTLFPPRVTDPIIETTVLRI